MKKTIRDVELNNKVVLIRVDFNVPMKNGVITNDNRIVQALPTIQYALDQNAKVVLFSHLGRVKTEEDKAKNSLAPVAKKLAEILPNIPLDRLVLETDEQYLTPEPHRGKRNEPAFTTYVADKMADILGLSRSDVESITTQNANRLFGI